MSLFTTALILFFIIDPIGNIPVCADVVKDFPRPRQVRILLRELFVALAVMLGFSFAGEWIFVALEIKAPAIWIASGIILFLVSIKILFPHLGIQLHRGNEGKSEPWILPIAIPTIAGPSLVATIMLFAHMESSIALMNGAILIAWACSAALILAAPWIRSKVSANLLEAMEKLMGMVLILLAMQRLLVGLKLFLQANQLVG